MRVSCRPSGRSRRRFGMLQAIANHAGCAACDPVIASDEERKVTRQGPDDLEIHAVLLGPWISALETKAARCQRTGAGPTRTARHRAPRLR